MKARITESTVFQLRPHARLQQDEARQCMMLLLPERVVQLNDTAAIILQLCDGIHTTTMLVQKLEACYQSDDIASDAMTFLHEAIDHKWITVELSPPPAKSSEEPVAE